MKEIRSIDIQSDTGEELLPGYSEEFPYIASRARLSEYREPNVPWHCHRTAELFYMESGCLEYETPRGKWTFSAGSGGFVNANVLNSSHLRSSENTVQLLHLFEPDFLSGGQGNGMERKYILPLTAASDLELIPLYPNDERQNMLLRKIRQAFEWTDREWGYEWKLRAALGEIWLELLALTGKNQDTGNARNADDKIKRMMIFVQEHFAEPITVEQLAQTVHISKRLCFRLFRENLHMTPVEYIRSCRLQRAGELLCRTELPVTEIGYACGLGSGSYFGKQFRERFGCTPLEYRKNWHDRDRIVRK